MKKKKNSPVVHDCHVSFQSKIQQGKKKIKGKIALLFVCLYTQLLPPPASPDELEASNRMTRTITQCCIMSFRNNARAIQTSFLFFLFYFKSISYIRTARYVSPCHWIMLFDQDISFDDRDTNLSLDTSRCFSYIYSSLFILFFFFCVNFYSGGGFKHSRMGSLIPASLWNISL